MGTEQPRHDDGTYKPKRHVAAADHTITVEMTDFEAMFVANALWNRGQTFRSSGFDNVADAMQWWARRLHAERETRDS